MGVVDPRTSLEAARRQGGAPLPGATEVWVVVALVVFVVAGALAFVLNDDDPVAAPAAVAAPADSEPGSAAPQPSNSGADAAASAAPAGDTSEASAAQPDPPADADAPATAASDPPAPATSEAPLLGFSIPVAGACVPTSELLLPGSARAYRNGIHEGVDFYSGDVGGCPADLSVTLATPILAAKQGVVIRTDWDYVEMTQAELNAAAAAGFQGEEILDRFRGRQIWIDHGDDIVSRYAHLGAIAAGIQVGQTVAVGQIVGFAGESGTPESVQAPGSDVHLHFEIRVGDGYLGQGLPIAQARALYLEAFGIVEPSRGG